LKALVLTPFVGAQNPYQTLLLEALRGAGVDAALAHERGRLPLRDALREHGRPDVVHIQWQHSYFVRGRVPALLRGFLFLGQIRHYRRRGIGFVWTVHNITNHGGRFRRWESFMSALLARAVHRMVVHCASTVGQVAAAYRVDPARISVVPHGHLEGWYPPAPSRAAARERLGLEPGLRVLLFFGQIRPYKGLGRLLDAFGHAGRETDRLVLLGPVTSDAFAAGIETRAAGDPRVSTDFRFLPDDELVAWLAAADAVVLPYEHMLASTAVMAAATAGRAIVAPRLGCLRDFPEGACLLYEPGDPEGLRRTLERLDGVDLDAVGAAARSHALSSPWSRVGRQTAALYDRVAAAASGARATAT
jgi:glycosyltransferase involved in cell wall biosynthesis